MMESHLPAEVTPVGPSSQDGRPDSPASQLLDSRNALLKKSASRVVMAQRLKNAQMTSREELRNAATSAMMEAAEVDKACNLNYDNTSWLATMTPKLVGVNKFVVVPWALITIAAILIEVTAILDNEVRIPSEVSVALGGLMSLLLAFRLNSSFNRWWEARNLWGNIVQGSRTLILQLITTATGVAHVEHISHEEDPHGSDHHSSRSDSPSQGPVADDTQCDVVPNVAAWCLAFPIALKQHLRGEPFPSSRTDDVEGKLPRGVSRLLSPRQIRDLSESGHPPLYSLLQLRTGLERFLQHSSRPGLEASIFNTLESFFAALTGCERILRTPCPPGYVGLLRLICISWMVMLPFTLVDVLGWIMIPVVSLVAFLVLSIEQLAVQIENPFGYDANDLPVRGLCLRVEADMLRLLAQARYPFRDFMIEAGHRHGQPHPR